MVAASKEDDGRADVDVRLGDLAAARGPQARASRPRPRACRGRGPRAGSRRRALGQVAVGGDDLAQARDEHELARRPSDLERQARIDPAVDLGDVGEWWARDSPPSSGDALDDRRRRSGPRGARCSAHALERRAALVGVVEELDRLHRDDDERELAGHTPASRTSPTSRVTSSASARRALAERVDERRLRCRRRARGGRAGRGRAPRARCRSRPRGPGPPAPGASSRQSGRSASYAPFSTSCQMTAPRRPTLIPSTPLPGRGRRGASAARAARCRWGGRRGVRAPRRRRVERRRRSRPWTVISARVEARVLQPDRHLGRARSGAGHAARPIRRGARSRRPRPTRRRARRRSGR